MRLLQRRVDALHLRYRGELATAVREHLVTALAQVKGLGLAAIAVDVGALTFALNSKKSHEGWWLMENDLALVVVDEGKHLDGWSLTVKLRALTLADRGPRACADLGAEIASTLLHLVDGERVAWIDLCADFSGFDVEAIDARQWVPRGRATVDREAPTPDESTAEYLLAGERVSFRIGRSDIVGRVYDKTVELMRDVVGEKRAAEHEAWRAAGWNGTDRVTRVEFQVRGDAIKEIDAGRLRDTERFVDRLNALWGYLTRKWLRLGRIGSATRRSRWVNDPRWDAVQAVTFDGVAEQPRRIRARGTPRVKYVVSIALTFAGKSGMLDDASLPRSHEIERWSGSEARRFVMTLLGALLGAVGDQLASDLLRTHGPTQAARIVLEKIHAARARTWTDCPDEHTSFAVPFRPVAA